MVATINKKTDQVGISVFQYCTYSTFSTIHLLVISYYEILNQKFSNLDSQQNCWTSKKFFRHHRAKPKLVFTVSV